MSWLNFFRGKRRRAPIPESVPQPAPAPSRSPEVWMIGEHKMPSPSDVHWKEDPYSTIMDRYNFQKDGTTITVSKMGGYETYYFAVNYQELHTTPTEAKPYWQALHTRFEAEHEAWKADQKAKALAALAKVMG